MDKRRILNKHGYRDLSTYIDITSQAHDKQLLFGIITSWNQLLFENPHHHEDLESEEIFDWKVQFEESTLEFEAYEFLSAIELPLATDSSPVLVSYIDVSTNNTALARYRKTLLKNRDEETSKYHAMTIAKLNQQQDKQKLWHQDITSILIDKTVFETRITSSELAELRTEDFLGDEYNDIITYNNQDITTTNIRLRKNNTSLYDALRGNFQTTSLKPTYREEQAYIINGKQHQFVVEEKIVPLNIHKRAAGWGNVLQVAGTTDYISELEISLRDFQERPEATFTRLNRTYGKQKPEQNHPYRIINTTINSASIRKKYLL